VISTNERIHEKQKSNPAIRVGFSCLFMHILSSFLPSSSFTFQYLTNLSTSLMTPPSSSPEIFALLLLVLTDIAFYLFIFKNVLFFWWG
jgi:hypothetical protein